jgi:hypothetical protein
MDEQLHSSKSTKSPPESRSDLLERLSRRVVDWGDRRFVLFRHVDEGHAGIRSFPTTGGTDAGRVIFDEYDLADRLYTLLNLSDGGRVSDEQLGAAFAVLYQNAKQEGAISVIPDPDADPGEVALREGFAALRAAATDGAIDEPIPGLVLRLRRLLRDVATPEDRDPANLAILTKWTDTWAHAASQPALTLEQQRAMREMVTRIRSLLARHS